MVRGIVLITVGEHQPDVCSKLLSVSVLSAVHFFLLEKRAVNRRSHSSVLVSVSLLMITSLDLNLSVWSPSDANKHIYFFFFFFYVFSFQFLTRCGYSLGFLRPSSPILPILLLSSRVSALRRDVAACCGGLSGLLFWSFSCFLVFVLLCRVG